LVDLAYTGHYGNVATAQRQPFSGIVVHVTGKPDLHSELDFMHNPATSDGGYLGYHFLVDRDGRVYQTAPFDARTNHILADRDRTYRNDNALGVAFVTGGSGPNHSPLPPTPAQLQAGKALVDNLRTQFNIPVNRVVGHGEIQTDRGDASNLNSDGGAEGKDFLNFYRGTGASSAAPVLASAVNAQPARPGQAQAANPSSPIYDGLIARGFSPAQAYALMGNMKQESNFSPGADNPGEGAHGLIQWRQDRRTNLQNFAAAQGTPVDDLNTQLDFLKHEMTQGSEAKSAAPFLASTDLAGANAALHGYIRYGDNTEPVRLANAQAFASGKDVPSGGGGGSGNAALVDTAQAPDDWQKILGAEAPPEIPSLASAFDGSVAQGYGGARGAAFTAQDTPLPPVAMPDVAASYAPEELSARYDETKPARRTMAPLSDLFTLKTIGQPASKATPMMKSIG
jgi:hypothetical protein